MTQKEVSLDLLNQSLDRVGKREMEKDDLLEFAEDTLSHETQKIKERTKMYQDGEIKENEINQFGFYNDGYHYGVFIKLVDDNIYKIDGDDVMQLPKKKDGELERDDNGDIIYTDRCLMRLKTRAGAMSVFLGIDKVQAISNEEKTNHFVLVGGISESEYKGRKQYTLNCWQIVSVRQRGKTIQYDADYNCNWDEDE
jgi:hypothetical protein